MLNEAPDNLSGLSLQPPCKCQSPVFFSLSSNVSDDVSGKNSAFWMIYFCLEPLYNAGFSFTLGQQASPLRKRSLPQKELQTKVFLLGQCDFVSYILRHIAMHRKKPQGASIFRDTAIMIKR